MKRRIYTPAQVAQHSQLLLDLQKSNALASHLVLRLGRMRLEPHRLEPLCDELASLVRMMTWQIFLCEQVADSEVPEHCVVVELVIGTTCDYCLENGRPGKVQKDEPHAEALKPTETWAIQIEGLSGLLISVARKISQISFSPKRTVELSLRSLGGLSKVLSRQRRHTEDIFVPQPRKINTIDDRSTVCPDCGHPHPPDIEDEEDEECI